MHHDTYACFRCDGQPTIYAVPQTVPVLDFIADHEEWHRRKDAFRGAMIAMSRFLVFVWLEALAQGWAATDGCDIEQARDEIGLNEVLGVLVQSGRIRLTWSD